MMIAVFGLKYLFWGGKSELSRVRALCSFEMCKSSGTARCNQCWGISTVQSVLGHQHSAISTVQSVQSNSTGASEQCNKQRGGGEPSSLHFSRSSRFSCLLPAVSIHRCASAS